MPFRVTALLKRKPGMSFEEFDEHWGKRHAPIFTNLKVVQEHVIQYTQFHLLPQAQDALQAGGAAIAPYDGVVDLLLDDIADLEKLFADEELQQKAYKDEENFLDRKATVILVGGNQIKYPPA